jgi:hypothetical protein
VLPNGQSLSVTAIRHQVRQTAERLETERGQAQDRFEDGSADQDALPEAAVPQVIGLDGVYVHAKGQRSRTEGWFEVIVGKRLATEDQPSPCFGFVSCPRLVVGERVDVPRDQSSEPIGMLLFQTRPELGVLEFSRPKDNPKRRMSRLKVSI